MASVPSLCSSPLSELCLLSFHTNLGLEIIIFQASAELNRCTVIFLLNLPDFGTSLPWNPFPGLSFFFHLTVYLASFSNSFSGDICLSFSSQLPRPFTLQFQGLHLLSWFQLPLIEEVPLKCTYPMELFSLPQVCHSNGWWDFVWGLLDKYSFDVENWIYHPTP